MMDALLNLTMVTAPAAGASERKRTKFKSDLKDKQKLFAEALNELLVVNPDFDQKKVSSVAEKHVRGEKRLERPGTIKKLVRKRHIDVVTIKGNQVFFLYGDRPRGTMRECKNNM